MLRKMMTPLHLWNLDMIPRVLTLRVRVDQQTTAAQSECKMPASAARGVTEA